MKTIIKLIIFAIIISFAYNRLRNKNEDVKKLEYTLTTTSIKDVVSDPKHYSETTVSGRVKTSINVLGVGYFSLEDPKDNAYVIWVKPKSDFVPNEGTLQKISGTVKQQLKVGSIKVLCLVEN